MKHPLLILSVLILSSSQVMAAWSLAEPKTALLKSFDAKCALFLEKKTNKTVKIEKSALKGLRLKSGETEISYISPEEEKHVCVQ